MPLRDVCFWALLLAPAAWLPAVRAEEPVPPSTASRTSTASVDPDSVYRQALEMERDHNWSGAIRVYQDALEQWPGRVEFRHRLRLCETHYRLTRRYSDRSFREELLSLGRTQAIDLFGEILERIQSHYVEPVPIEPLLRRGYDNMEVALRDPAFLDLNAPNANPERLQWLREAFLKRRQQITAQDRAGALAEIDAACSLSRQAITLPDSAVILEFAFGACDSLDDYSTYLTPDRLDDLYSMIDGNFVGLGVELKLDEEVGLLLVNVLKGGPAAEAGLKPGDRISHVDDRPLAGLDLDAAANRLQGIEGSRVRLTLKRADGSSPTLTLTRRPVEVKSVAEAKIVDPVNGVGYIQLTGFQKTSTAELDAAIASLQREGLRYLVIDLRGNPGGLLNVAVEIADQFLESGVIVTTRGRAQGQSQVFRATGRTLWRVPLALLIDRNSASASEILAGALQDNHRAIVLGEQSFGKGSVQSIFPLRTAPAGLKLTTAKFYSPRDRAYSEQGVRPDTEVRSAARPTGPDADLPAVGLGDPDRDPVLRAAIDQARTQALGQAG
jgi:carboxyl-terminal processing protease